MKVIVLKNGKTIRSLIKLFIYERNHMYIYIYIILIGTTKPNLKRKITQYFNFYASGLNRNVKRCFDKGPNMATISAKISKKNSIAIQYHI